MKRSVGTQEPKEVSSSSNAQDFFALLTKEPQDPLTSRNRHHALCVARWRYLMDVRGTLVEQGPSPPELDRDIERVYDASAWPGIDQRIKTHEQFNTVRSELRLSPNETTKLWHIVTAALYTKETQVTCEDCVAEAAEILSMKHRLAVLQLDTSLMDRAINECFEPLIQAHGKISRTEPSAIKDEAFKAIKKEPGSKEPFSLTSFPTVKTVKQESRWFTEASDKRKDLHAKKPFNAVIARPPDSRTPNARSVDNGVLISPTLLPPTDNKDSIAHALNHAISSIKRGGPIEATHALTEGDVNQSNPAAPKRKRRKKNTSAVNYKRCTQSFRFPINAVGDGFLHLRTLPHTAGNLLMSFDVDSQHLNVRYRGESLSTMWPNLKAPAKGIYMVERAQLFVQADRFVRIYYLDEEGVERILEVQVASREDCRTLIQKLQEMNGCKEVVGNFKTGEDKVFKSRSSWPKADTFHPGNLNLRQIEVEAAGLGMFWDFQHQSKQVDSGNTRNKKS